jgi:hypothetical protein
LPVYLGFYLLSTISFNFGCLSSQKSKIKRMPFQSGVKTKIRAFLLSL